MKLLKSALILTFGLALVLSPALVTTVFAENNTNANVQVSAKADAKTNMKSRFWHFFGGKDRSDKDSKKDDSDRNDYDEALIAMKISAEDRTRFCDNKAWLARILPPGIYKVMDKRLCGTPTPTPSDDKTGPVISNVKTIEISANRVVLTWDTDEKSSSDVAFGLTTAYGYMITHWGLTNPHRVEIRGLTANTTYHFHVISKDRAGNSSTSADMTFTTNGIVSIQNSDSDRHSDDDKDNDSVKGTLRAVLQ